MFTPLLMVHCTALRPNLGRHNRGGSTGERKTQGVRGARAHTTIRRQTGLHLEHHDSFPVGVIEHAVDNNIPAHSHQREFDASGVRTRNADGHLIANNAGNMGDAGYRAGARRERCETDHRDDQAQHRTESNHDT